MGYGAEAWGWKERQEMEMLQERFLRWVLGADNSTPEYMIREELQREKIRSKTARRAWSFERLEEGISKIILGRDEEERGKEKRYFGIRARKERIF